MLDQAFIPQCDPGAAARSDAALIREAVAAVLASGQFILGGQAADFEREFATRVGTQRAVSCASGTDALALSLHALGAGPGSAVVSVSHCPVPVIAAIEIAGAKPLLIDIDPAYYTMDPAELAEVLDRPPAGSPPIRAVIAVHLYGQPADLAHISAICRRRGVLLIEDCSQAHGARIGDRSAGAVGAAAAFSFYPTKNLGALGDAGVITTNDHDLADRLAALRQYGWRDSTRSSLEPGVNSRMDEIQAAVLRRRLRLLERRNSRRCAIAGAYSKALARGSLAPPARRPGTTHVFHQFVLRAPDRDTLRARLHEDGIGTAIHYPVPLHLQPAYKGRIALGPSGCKASELAAAQVLSLPMFPDMTDGQVRRVCATLRRLP